MLPALYILREEATAMATSVKQMMEAADAAIQGLGRARGRDRQADRARYVSEGRLST
jgi:hypothetical protein